MGNTRQPIEVLAVSIEKFFNSADLINIPVYQRDFQWTPEHAAQLVEDILNAFMLDPNSAYFLGQVVVHKDQGSLKAEINLVDGQQRVTTLVILFLLLHTKLSDQVLKEKLRKSLCKPKSRQPRIRNEADQTVNEELMYLIYHNDEFNGLPHLRDLSRESLRNDGISDYLRLIRQIADHIESMLDKDCNGDDLPKFAEFALSKCLFSAVECQTQDMATDIFSSINNRGLPLSVLDNIKVLALKNEMRTSTSAALTYANTLRNLGDVGMQNLLLTIAHFGDNSYPLLQRGNWARVVTKSFAERNREGRKWFTREMFQYRQSFSKLISRKPKQFDKDIQKHLVSLNTLGDSHIWAPTAILFEKNTSLNKTGNRKVFFDLLETFATMIFVINNASGNFVRKRQILKDISTTRIKNINAKIKKSKHFEDVKKELSLTPDEHEAFSQALARGIYGSGVRQRVALHLLMRLENEKNPNIKYFDHEELSVEHVFPQSSPPTNEWTVDDIARYLHAVGNLTLLTLSDNKTLQAKSYEHKAKTYAGSTFLITKELADGYKTWTVDDCKKRHQEILGKLEEIYGLRKIDTVPEPAIDISLEDEEDITAKVRNFLKFNPKTLEKEDVERLLDEQFDVKKTYADGNSQFEALTTWAPDAAWKMRKKAVKWLSKNADKLILENGLSLKDTKTQTIGTTWENYLNELGKDETSGDEITLLVAATIYKTNIHVFRCALDDKVQPKLMVIRPLPAGNNNDGDSGNNNDGDSGNNNDGEPEYYLFFYGENKYSGVRPRNPDTPPIGPPCETDSIDDSVGNEGAGPSHRPSPPHTHTVVQPSDSGFNADYGGNEYDDPSNRPPPSPASQTPPVAQPRETGSVESGNEREGQNRPPVPSAAQLCKIGLIENTQTKSRADCDRPRKEGLSTCGICHHQKKRKEKKNYITTLCDRALDHPGDSFCGVHEQYITETKVRRDKTLGPHRYTKRPCSAANSSLVDRTTESQGSKQDSELPRSKKMKK